MLTEPKQHWALSHIVVISSSSFLQSAKEMLTLVPGRFHPPNPLVLRLSSHWWDFPSRLFSSLALIHTIGVLSVNLGRVYSTLVKMCAYFMSLPVGWWCQISHERTIDRNGRSSNQGGVRLSDSFSDSECLALFLNTWCGSSIILVRSWIKTIAEWQVISHSQVVAIIRAGSGWNDIAVYGNYLATSYKLHKKFWSSYKCENSWMFRVCLGTGGEWEGPLTASCSIVMISWLQLFMQGENPAHHLEHQALTLYDRLLLLTRHKGISNT